MSTFAQQPSGVPPTLHVRRQPADLGAALRAAQALVGQHEAGLGPPYLAHVDENQGLARGSAAPLLGLSWQQLPCGLLVPPQAATMPAPVDQMKVYLTAEEVFGGRVDGAWIQDQLQRPPLEEVLTYAATFLNRLRQPGVEHAELDRQYASQFLRGLPRELSLIHI